VAIGVLQLRVYSGKDTAIPVDWLLGIIRHFMGSETSTLFRPVGQKEFDQIRGSGMREFPRRIPFQSIIDPVLNEEFAIQIARDWNTKDPASGYVEYVTRFQVKKEYLSRYQSRWGASSIKSIGFRQKSYLSSTATSSVKLKSLLNSIRKISLLLLLPSSAAKREACP
jgi:hypothetical protein